jgi:hypothetical protein
MATKTEKKAAEPIVVENADLTIGDAHAVLDLDGTKFRLGGELVHALRRAFESAHAAINPGH